MSCSPLSTKSLWDPLLLRRCTRRPCSTALSLAVKVRRPGIVDTVARDFALIEKILYKFLKEDKVGIDIKGMILELENTSKTELDLTNEAKNLDRFWNNNNGREKVESPKCYRLLTCEAVLTEDFVIGTEVSDTGCRTCCCGTCAG